MAVLRSMRGARNRYPEAIHRGEIGLSHAPGDVLLWKHDILLWAMTNWPRLSVPLQRTQRDSCCYRPGNA